ncbi:MAG TPA: aldehyde dehydrogenase family protein [Streptosporangiaceae bacterium]
MADRFRVEDPATGEVITLVQGGGTAEVNAAVEAAHRAFQTDWRWRPPAARVPDCAGTGSVQHLALPRYDCGRTLV